MPPEVYSKFWKPYISKKNSLYSMEQIPSWESNRRSADREILSLLCKTNVYFHVHESPSSLGFILISYHLCLGLSSGHFPSGFSNKILYVFIISPMNATCPAHFILLAVILFQEYEPWSSSLLMIILSILLLTFSLFVMSNIGQLIHIIWSKRLKYGCEFQGHSINPWMTTEVCMQLWFNYA
jgi:hypothetical protein